jgi:hypothetical protein
MYQIKTDLDGLVVTVLHFLMHQYISKKIDGSDGENLIKMKFKLINITEVNVKKLFRLEIEGRDLTYPQHDSFLDGGVILLWCLAYNKVQLLIHFLGVKMINFWRFAPIKTLIWACMLHQPKYSSRSSAIKILQIVFDSPVMHNIFNEMSMVQKVIMVGQILDLGEGMERPIRRILS